jgi:hypothetical protein
MKRLGRLRLVLGLLALFVVLAAGAVGCAKLYLSSGRGAQQITSKLEDVLGVPVRVGGADVGIQGDSTLSGLQLYEADGQRPDKAWLTVQGVRTDLSLIDVIRGDTSPQRVELSGAAVDLRFDEDGSLVTKLPHVKPTGKPYPKMILHDARLTLDQAGRKPMVIEGVNAEGSDDGGTLEFHGTVKDPHWGDWTVEGSFNAAEGNVQATLKTPHTHVTQEKLESLPFVSKAVWEQVKIEKGDTPVDLQLHFTVGESGAHYRVELHPTNTMVDVTSIELHAEKASGEVVIKDRVVTLNDVEGTIAGGTINLKHSVLDFSRPAYDMMFEISVRSVDVRELPESWKIPKVSAFKYPRLNGAANLRLLVKDGKVQTMGTGKGTIDAVFDGKPVTITLNLHGDGKGFRYSADPKSLLQLFRMPSRPPAIVEEQGNAAEEEQQQQQPAGPHPLAQPLGQATQLLRSATGTGLDFGRRGMAQVNRWTKGLQPGQKTNYLEASTRLKDVDLEQLIDAFQLKLPFAVTGKVTLTVQFAVPIDTPNDYRAYKLRGSAESPGLTVAGVEMKDVTAKVRYEDGLLTLQELKGKFPDSGGTFAGDGTMQLLPSGDLKLKLDVNQVPLSRALALLPGAEGKADGVLTGHVEARVPVNRLRDPKAWNASGTLRSDRLAVYGVALTKAKLALTVTDGVAMAHDLDVEVEGGRVTGSAEVTLGGDYPYKGRLVMKDADLTALQRLSPTVRPPVTVKGRAAVVADLRGKLSPLTFAASGTAQANELTIADVLVDSASFKWSLEENRIRLTDISAKLYQGTITGSATVPLKEMVDGGADLKVDGVDAQRLVKAVGVVPIKIEGHVSGTVTGKVAGAAPNKPRELTTNIELAAAKMRVQGVAAQKVRGHINYRPEGGDYKLEGEALGGKFELEGKLPPPGERPAPPKEPEGRLRLEGMRLSRLADATGIESLSSLSGRLDLDLPFNYEGPDRHLVGSGRFTVRNVRWAGTELADSIRGDARLTGTVFQLRDVTGNLGDGSLRLTLNHTLCDPERSWFNLQIERVDAAVLLTPLLTGGPPPATSQRVGATTMPIQGALDIQLRGNLGREWRASGNIALTRGKIFGAEVSEVRLPISLAYAPSQGTGELTFADNTAQLARGRVQGRATLRWGDGLRLEGGVRFFDVDVPTLLRSAGPEVSKIAEGRMSGRLDFGGENIRSLDDLTAKLDASFTQAQPLQLPVLDVVARYVAPGQSTMTFPKGDVQATLSRGVVRVKRLTMSNSALQMIVEGTVNLSGRVDLDVTASTGAAGLAAALLPLRVPAVGPIPGNMIAQTSTLLAARTIHLRVTGTVRNPSVQIDPVRLLTEEAVRFFAGAAVGVPLP